MNTIFPEVVANFAHDEPDKQVFTFLFTGRPPLNVTVDQVHRDACRLAAYLSEQGIKAGEFLPIAFDFGYPLVAAFLAAVYAGAVPSIMPYLSAEDPSPASLAPVQNLVRFSHAQAVLTSGEFQAIMSEDLAGENCRVIALPQMENLGSNAGDDWAPVNKPEDIAFIQFSSGTTGLPKGVMISQATLMHYLAVSAEIVPTRPEDVVVSWSPLSHNMGLFWLVLQTLYSRMHSVLIRSADWMRQPQILFSAVDHYHGTISYLPNFAYRYCATHINDADIAGLDLSSWRVLGNGSEPVRIEDMRAFAERFAPYGLRSSAMMVIYGQAEHVANISMTPRNQFPDCEWVSEYELGQSRAVPVEPGSNGSLLITSCGYPRPDTSLRIVDEQNQELKEREVGEIIVRSPNLFSGYYLLPEETALVMRQGWLHTGDLGYLVGGQLYVCGRKKDLIIISGRNILPVQIEQIAESTLGELCRSTAAFGIPNVALGTEVGVVACEMWQLPDEENRIRLRNEITRRVLQELQIYLSDVCLVESGWIVKTPGGKIKHAANREKYLAEKRQAGNTAAPEARKSESSSPLTATEQILIRIWEKLFNNVPIDVDDNFFELGGDSLLAVQLGLEVEANFHCKMPTSVLLTAPTPSSLAQFIDNDEQATIWNTLVPIQPVSKQSTRPTFFCVHGIGGGVLDFEKLARAMGPEQPLYALQPRGLVDESQIDTTIEEMAAHYILSIQHLQPLGPYHIGGYSFGSAVAYEMGRQLAEAGEKVGLVASLDQPAPRRVMLENYRLHNLGYIFSSLGDILSAPKNYLLELTPAQRGARRRHWLRVIRKRVLQGLGIKVNLDNELASLPTITERITEMGLEADNHYSPKPYQGRMVVFCTPATMEKFGKHDPYLDWKKIVTGPVEIQAIQGTHLTIFDEPNVSTLAEKLKIYLKFDGEGNTHPQ